MYKNVYQKLSHPLFRKKVDLVGIIVYLKILIKRKLFSCRSQIVVRMYINLIIGLLFWPSCSLVFLRFSVICFLFLSDNVEAFLTPN